MPHLDFAAVLQGQFLAWLWSGWLFSLQLSAITWCLALPLAVAIALLRLAPAAPLRALGAAYVEAVRSVPLLVHMLIWYFGVPELLPPALKQRLYAGNIEAVAAVAALTVYSAAYMAEDIRSGLRAIPAQQFEAARALGFRFLQGMRLLILPQALRICVPPLISQTLNLWKNTSVATVIGAAELMYQAQRVESASFRGFETFAAVTGAYLLISLSISLLAACYQRRYPARIAASSS